MLQPYKNVDIASAIFLILFPIPSTGISNETFVTFAKLKTSRKSPFYESINGGEPTCIDDDIPFEIPDSRKLRLH